MARSAMTEGVAAHSPVSRQGGSLRLATSSTATEAALTAVAGAGGGNPLRRGATHRATSPSTGFALGEDLEKDGSDRGPRQKRPLPARRRGLATTP